MPGLPCPSGRASLSTGHKDSGLQCQSHRRWGVLPLCVLHVGHRRTHQSASSKLARSALHPVIITVPNRRHICVARPPRQSEAAVQFPLPLWPSDSPPHVHSGTVCLSRSTTCVYCVLCCVRWRCQMNPPCPPNPHPHTRHLSNCLQKNTQRGDGRGFLTTKD